MWVVTHGAPFAQGFVFENKWPRLLPMALCAVLIQPRHRQPARWFEYVAAVRIVALDAVHVTFNHWMMLRHAEFRFRLQMALKTRSRVFSRVHNKLTSSSACLDVLAAGPVAGFAARFAVESGVVDVDTGMGTGGKNSGNIRMTLGTGAIADIGCARDIRRCNNRSSESRAGYCEKENEEEGAKSRGHVR
jgi:hypothetical protein